MTDINLVDDLRTKISTKYLDAIFLHATPEKLNEALTIVHKDDPVQYLKLYGEILKRDPSLPERLGLSQIRGFAWVELAPRVIYVDADGSKWEAGRDGERIPVEVPSSPDSINYMKPVKAID